jgi:tetraacyldisaccharide 4'-kinase
MVLEGDRLVNLRRLDRTLALADLAGHTVHALAGIGHPQRFFDLLKSRGLQAIPHPFSDHHAFSPGDLPDGPVLMTEKDAVKCAAFAHDDCWFLPVDASPEPGLKALILTLLPARHGPQTA